ncbi:MAG: response regulator [Cyanobacteria bacterium J06639_14]
MPLPANTAFKTLSTPNPTHRVLIVEDGSRLATLMAKGLQRAGFPSEILRDGTTVLDKVVGDHFDLILLDLGLAAKDGRLVLHELRSHGVTVPVVIVTACPINPQDDEIVYTLADEVIRKPFMMKDLVRQVRSLLVA